MSKSTDIRIADAVVSHEDFPFRTPLKFGGRVMDRHRLINVEVTVESRNRKHATGFGSMPVGQVWAWPSDQVSPEQAESAMCDFAERVARLTDDLDEFGHPIDIIFHVSAEYSHLAKVVANEHKLPEPLPNLAQLVAASPLDAAIHDAYGTVNDRNSYDVLSKEFMNNDLAYYLDDQFAGEYLNRYTLREPTPRMPLYHLIGAMDPLTEADVTTPLDDDVPVTLQEWIAAEGVNHFKIKLSGEDLDWDINRVLSIDQVVGEALSKRGSDTWFYSLDFNEKCPNVEALIAFLRKLQEQNPQAFDRVQYLEQPTNRNLEAHDGSTMHEAAKLKPVVIDESLIDYDSLLAARDLGYSGVALKACKGHTEALFAAAAAQKFGMFLCVQDLTCPGYSFLHSASLASRIPGVTAIEGNGRQYCPIANKTWAREFPELFEITDGTVGTGCLTGTGLGY